MNSNIAHIGYITPQSVAKKKVFAQLQNALSSRKEQSTLDTSSDQKNRFDDKLKGEQLEGTKFLQSLFNYLLNECDAPTTLLTETNYIRESI